MKENTNGNIMDELVDVETLFRQSTSTARHYMAYARDDIDDLYGPGYASEHPELVAAYMRTAAIDFGCGLFAREFCRLTVCVMFGKEHNENETSQ